MSGRDTIICVDDEEGVLTVLEEQLRHRFGHECTIETASSAAAALELIAEIEGDGDQVALVLADQMMPGMVGSKLLEIVDRQCPDAMKVLLTGQAGLDAVIASINNARLNYYLSKPWDEEALLLAVDNLLRQFRLARENRTLVEQLRAKNFALLEMNRGLEARVYERTQELKLANDRLAELAVTDGLTGLYNHRHFHERLGLEAERSGRNGRPLSVLMIDVDHFKAFNDAYGHPCGDEVLRRLARALGEGRRVNDLVGRVGGEEFAVLLVETPKAAAIAVAEKVRAAVADLPPLAVPGDEPAPTRPVTISVGVASMPEDGATAEALMFKADKALYAAKHAGRNRVVAAGEVAGETARGQ